MSNKQIAPEKEDDGGIIRTVCAPHDQFICNKTGSQDARLSYAARGLLWSLLAHGNSWQVRVGHLIKNNPKGRDTVRGILRELRRFGYLKRTRGNNEETGRIEWISTVYDTPQPVDEEVLKEIDATEQHQREKRLARRNKNLNPENDTEEGDDTGDEESDDYPDNAPETPPSPEKPSMAPSPGYPSMGKPSPVKQPPNNNIEGSYIEDSDYLTGSRMRAGATGNDGPPNPQRQPEPPQPIAVPNVEITEQNAMSSAGQRFINASYARWQHDADFTHYQNTVIRRLFETSRPVQKFAMMREWEMLQAETHKPTTENLQLFRQGWSRLRRNDGQSFSPPIPGQVFQFWQRYVIDVRDREERQADNASTADDFMSQVAAQEAQRRAQ